MPGHPADRAVARRAAGALRYRVLRRTSTSRGLTTRGHAQMAVTKLTKGRKPTAAAAAPVAMTGGSLPASAGPGSATLYELTENMQLDTLSKPTLRTASAALQGMSNLGTPLC